MNPDEASTPKSFSADLHHYSAPVDDVRKSTHDFLWRTHRRRTQLWVLGTLVVAIAAGFVAPPFAVIPIFILLIAYSQVTKKMQKLFYTQLAETLGCTYSAGGKMPTEGRLFTFGDRRRVSNTLSGVYNGVPFRLGEYSYDEGSGKNRRTYPYIFAELSFSSKLPGILCRPEKWALEVFDSWEPKGYRQLSLEGGFNDSFTVYVPEDQEMEALQILEPNVMEKLMHGFGNYGFECVGQHVYLFTPGRMTENRAGMMSLYSLLQHFCDVLTPELRSFLK
jgi:hypothetical protein